MQELLIICLIGAIAGWIAGALVNVETGSLLLDILMGIIGGYLGYKLFGNRLNITSNHWVNLIITSTVGASILAIGIKLLRQVFSRRS
jgi:uncharacterized membrane protein YeaQ/YmgE (transglycosylase-associated protein family)